MIIYIRHAEDENGSIDSHITDKGRRDAKRVAQELIEKYGRPTVIFCSPFARTRETLKSMLEVVDETIVIINPLFSRYFCSKERNKEAYLKLTPETKLFDIPVYETKDKFNHRVVHSFELIQEAKDYENGVYWVITHALFLSAITKHCNLWCPKHINFLQYFIMDW